MTRCCDRKSKKARTFGCQKCTLIFLTILCCGAIGGGLYGNDDLHNGLVQVFNAGKQLNRLFINVRNQVYLFAHHWHYDTATYPISFLTFADILFIKVIKGSCFLSRDRWSLGYSRFESFSTFLHDWYSSTCDEKYNGSFKRNWCCIVLYWTIQIGSVVKVAHWWIWILWTLAMASYSRIFNIFAFLMYRPCNWCCTKLAMFIDILQCSWTFHCCYLLVIIRGLLGYVSRSCWFLRFSISTYMQSTTSTVHLSIKLRSIRNKSFCHSIEQFQRKHWNGQEIIVPIGRYGPKTLPNSQCSWPCCSHSYNTR